MGALNGKIAPSANASLLGITGGAYDFSSTGNIESAYQYEDSFTGQDFVTPASGILKVVSTDVGDSGTVRIIGSRTGTYKEESVLIVANATVETVEIFDCVLAVDMSGAMTTFGISITDFNDVEVVIATSSIGIETVNINCQRRYLYLSTNNITTKTIGLKETTVNGPIYHVIELTGSPTKTASSTDTIVEIYTGDLETSVTLLVRNDPFITVGGNYISGFSEIQSATELILIGGNSFYVTGTTNITSISSDSYLNGAQVILVFDGILTVSDGGGNIALAGNFVTSANDTLTLVKIDNSWLEVSRSTN